MREERRPVPSPPARLIKLAALLLAAVAMVSPASAQPTFDKAFTPDTIGPGSVSSLRFDITNNGSVAVQNLAFDDTLPSGVTIATPANAASSCFGTVAAPGGGSTISLFNGGVGASGSCFITVDVTSSTPGTHTNVSGDLTSDAGNSGSATDDLTVATDRPGFTKSFSPSPVPFGGRSTLTFTFDNTANASSASNLTFTDNLPSGMRVASPANASTTCTGGTITANPGASVISYGSFLPGDGAVGALSSCTLRVDVVGGSVGVLGNTSGELTSVSGFTTRSSGKASATLTVTVERLSLTKEFTDDPALPGGAVTLEFTVRNLDRRNAATGIAFTDDLEATLSGLTATGLPLLDPCGSGSLLSETGGVLGLAGGNLAAEAGCTFSVALQVPATAVPGAYTNTTSIISGDAGGQPVSGSAATDDLFVSSAPTLTKTFLTNPVGAGGTTTVELTITNNSSVASATNIAFTDNLDAFIGGVSVTSLPANGFCGTGSSLTTTLVFGELTLVMAGGNLPASASCTFSADLQLPEGAAGGTLVNTTSEITATVGEASVIGNPAVAELVVATATTLLKQFTDDPVLPGGSVTLEFTVSRGEEATFDATDITFTDDLDAALSGLVSTSPPQSDVCGAGSQISGTSNLTFSGGTLAPGESCSFSVALDVPETALPGRHTNTTSSVLATVETVADVTGRPGQDDLQITGLTFTKAFIDDPVIAGGTVTLEFTLDNSSSSLAATGISFTDDLDDVIDNLAANGLPLTDPCGTGSSLTGTAGDTRLSFAGGSLAAGATCTFSVTMDVPAGTESGSYANTTSNLVADLPDGQGGFTTVVLDPATDGLAVSSELLSLTKEFTNDPVAPGATVDLELTVANLDASRIASGIGFTDDLDAALAGLVSTSGTVADVCGTGSQISGSDLLTLTGGNLAAGGSCTFSVTLAVPSTTPLGTVATNTTSQVTGTIDGLGVTGDPASDDLRIEFLELTKSFDSAAEVGTSVGLSFTLVNLGTITATDISFTDDLDAVLSGLASISGTLTDVCGLGSVLDGTSFLTLTGANLLPSGSCTFSVDLQVPAEAEAGSYDNVTSDIFLGASRGGDPASATLTVFRSTDCPDRAEIDYGDPEIVCAAAQNAVTVFNQTELDAYLADFGFDGSKYRNVKVRFDPTGDVTIISPCDILLRGEGGFLDVTADKVCLFGRRGIEVGGGVSAPNQSLTTQTLGLVSEDGSAIIKQKLTITADELSSVAEKEARIGNDCDVVVNGPLSLVSEGDVPSSDAIIRQGSVVSAETILLSASRTAKLGQSTVISAADILNLVSTGSATGSLASVEMSADVDATTFNQTSGNKVKVGENAVIDVFGNYLLNAVGTCTIKASATINAGSTSGNCFP